MPRGTPLHPGADPTRLATGLNLRAISLVEGARAGLAAAVPVAASVWLARPELTLAALGALLTCIVDPAGPMRRRLPLLAGFILAGGLLLGGFGLVRQCGIAATVGVAAPLLMALAYLRVWGQPAAALGNLLAVVLLLGTDDPLGWRDAARVGAIFAAGGAWALLLTIAIWRIHPYGPARRAVADVWAALADLAAMTRRLCEATPPGDAGGDDTGRGDAGGADAGWDSHARAGRGTVRQAIERARTILMDTMEVRGAASGASAQNLLRLEVADQVFAALIGLADRLEAEDPATRAQAVPTLRRLRALLSVMARATQTETLNRGGRLDRSIDALGTDATLPTRLAPYTRRLADRLHVATKTVDPAQYLPGSGRQGEAGVPLRTRLLGPARANANWRSASLRHASRSALVVGMALAATLVWHGHYTHWLTITLVLVMQPYFASTWQRSLERIGGTLLGGGVAALLSALMTSRLHVVGLLPVLGALALAVRQVSYGVYIAVYTPTVILLVESIHPNESQWKIATARAGFTILGGVIAVIANAVLWPSWEPDRVRADLRTAIRAHAAYAAAVLGEARVGEARAGEAKVGEARVGEAKVGEARVGAGDPGRRADRARREAGLASNNLEASLARVMQEPRRGHRDRLQAVLTADATLRRIAGRLAALAVDPLPASRPDRVAETMRWIVEAMAALGAGTACPPPPGAQAGVDTLERLARQVQVLAEISARVA